MKWNITEIQKEGQIQFSETLNLREELKARNKEIIEVTAIVVSGSVCSGGDYFDLDFTATYDITLPSSRSLAPVCLPMTLTIHETYVTEAFAAVHKEEVTEEMLFVLEGETLSLDAAVADNVLLEIPTRLLTKEEETSKKLPAGKDWQVISEEDYLKQKENEKKERSAFQQLNSLFEEN